MSTSQMSAQSTSQMSVQSVKPASPAEKTWVEQIISQTRSMLQSRHDSMHYMRRMRFMRLKSNAPRPFQRIVPVGLQSPFSYNLVQTAVGILTRDRPRFTRIPRTNTQAERAAANRLQSACDPLLQTFERIARRPLLTILIDHVVADGEAYARISRVPWAGFPVRGPNESEKDYNRRVAEFVLSAPTIPMRLRVPDPLTILAAPDVDGEHDFIIETGKRPLVPVLQTLGLRPGAGGRLEPMNVLAGETYDWRELPESYPALVDVDEVWTANAVYVRIAGQQLFVYPNDLGFIPYVHIPGIPTGVADPELANLSILYPYQGVEPWLATLMSTLAAWSILGGVPILWTSRQPYQGAPPPDATAPVSDIPLGKRIDLGTGGSIGFAQPPPVGREVLEFIQLLVNFLERSGLAPITQGIMGARTPGTAFNAAVEMALGRLTPIVANLEEGIAEIVRTAWRIVEQIDLPVFVTGETLKTRLGPVGRRRSVDRYIIDPRDINGYYDLHCELKIASLQDQISRGMHAAFMRAHKLWSRERAMRFAGVDEPWEEFRDIIRDQLEESPFVVQQILRKALEEEPELARRAAELEAQGVDVMSLLTGGMGEGGELYGGAPQPRGGPAPMAGGRPRGSPKQPGGTRQTRQPRGRF